MSYTVKFHSVKLKSGAIDMGKSGWAVENEKGEVINNCLHDTKPEADDYLVLLKSFGYTK